MLPYDAGTSAPEYKHFLGSFPQGLNGSIGFVRGFE